NNKARPSSVTLSQSQPAPDLCCMPSRLILSSRFSRQGTNDAYFLFPIWLSRLSEDVVKPDRRRLHYIRMLPGFPGIERLRLSGDKAPINGGDVMGFGNRQDGVEGAPNGAGHVFGADERTMIALEPANVLLEAFRPAVVVE